MLLISIRSSSSGCREKLVLPHGCLFSQIPIPAARGKAREAFQPRFEGVTHLNLAVPGVRVHPPAHPQGKVLQRFVQVRQGLQGVKSHLQCSQEHIPPQDEAASPGCSFRMDTAVPWTGHTLGDKKPDIKVPPEGGISGPGQ